jgi:hypothetical protein
MLRNGEEVIGGRWWMEDGTHTIRKRKRERGSEGASERGRVGVSE